MLYKKNKGKTLDMDLFKNPTSEYRGTPFWSWNCVLDKDMLMRQIEYLKEMGFGGFHMHSRAGMATEYLGEEFMELVRACRDKAKEENMLAWLYDEDRWPSGFAGGLVTKTKKFRKKFIVLSENKVDFVSKEQGTEEALPYLVKVFDIILNTDGTLKSYKTIGENDEAEGIKRYAYVKATDPTGRFNNQGYVDTLSGEAIQEFIDITYVAYKKSVGDSFGDIVPAIFTDEPQFESKQCLTFAHSHEDISLPWTTDLNDTFYKTYGYSIEEKLPELVWDLPHGKVSKARYHYHDHICERFTVSFADKCGKWCDENGIALTGHVMAEHTLSSQTRYLGETMRTYREFGIPGIDMLCDCVELSTAKQTQSAVHQYGREAMLSELYGVTNWDFDFRGHKFQGDWQAALGVTVRVPHLSWVSMKGSAKRDYPASINYQSPWYKEYSYVEDHFARLNTVLTRGKPVVKVGVIHPIESFWLHWGPSDTGSDIRDKMENNFSNIIKWLLTGMVDFDFISESLLPSQCGAITDTLSVGAMNYTTIVVPGCETLRRTTFEILKKFKEKGGKILFAGECPKYIDAEECDEISALYENSDKCGFEQLEILNALKEERTAEIFAEDGTTARNLLHALRQDNDVKWLFIAHAEKTHTTDLPIPENLTIILPSEYIPELYDTVKGEVLPMEFEVKNGKTYIYTTVYAYDSLLIKLKQGSGVKELEISKYELIKNIDFKANVEYSREEDNVCILDMAEYKLDGGEFEPVEEILAIDDKLRGIMGYPEADGRDAQPWILGEDKIEHYVTLRFKLESEADIDNIFIAAEETKKITVNGTDIKLDYCGYYVDESIKKYKAGSLKKGENIIEIVAPIGKRTSLENCFLLGDFDVAVRGCEKIVTPRKKKIGFGDIVSQGLPFYGGNITYKTEIKTDEKSTLRIRVSRYRGALVKVYLDGKEQGNIAYAPYTLDIKDVASGTHILEFKLFGNRVNTFGALHNCGYSTWYGPRIWYTYKEADPQRQSALPRCSDCDNSSCTTSAWSYEYVLKPTGILSSPLIQILK